MRASDESNGRERRPLCGGSVVGPFSGIVFAQGVRSSPAAGDKRSSRDHSYTPAGEAMPLYGHRTAEDLVAAWGAETLRREFTDQGEGFRVLAHASRRVACLAVTDLIVIDARNPRLLSKAGVRLDDLGRAAEARWRVAAVAQRTLGIGGLTVPPALPYLGDRLIVFPEHISTHVELLATANEPVRMALPSKPRDGAAVKTGDAVVHDLADARLRSEAPASSKQEAAGSPDG